ncbi:hypothetical protein CVT24_000972 [Panaeolus cyanescens]|uniref:FAD-binding FR-type domain-containing protein n=1 Tax=Panaeolus cyanescens TaxID=181874 RepID=A0A409YCH1_9AGAR|nr:hypothetical protein CVT24_000972 [Panaeolus cyanescens]
MPSLAQTLAAANPSDATLVYHVTLMLMAIMALFVICKLPRAIALFGTSEWSSGHILRYVPYKPTSHRRRRVVQAVHAAYPPPSPIKEADSSDSHTYIDHAPKLAYVQRIDEKGQDVKSRYPTHVAATMKPLRPILTPLRARISPGFSVCQLLMLAVYFYALIYATFYKSNVFTDESRTGWIAVAQLPLVFAFAQKNNILGSILGYGYERLNFLHRFVGRCIVLAANIHSFHFFYSWSLAGTFAANLRRTPVRWGIIALICLDMIYFFSVEFVRNKSYNFFLSTHILGFIIVWPATYYHKPSTLPYILAAVGLYLLDHLFRLVKTRVTTAFIKPIPELDATKIVVPKVNAGWRAGQHIRLRVLAPASGPQGMGWLKTLESHPFTIASVSQTSEDDGDGMVLIVKRAGGWTRRLYELAKLGLPPQTVTPPVRSATVTSQRSRASPPSPIYPPPVTPTSAVPNSATPFNGRGLRVSKRRSPAEAEAAVPESPGKAVKVILEGPYGGPGHTIFTSFSTCVLVVGGSGITFGLSVLSDIVAKELACESALRHVELVWSTPDASALLPLLPQFKRMLENVQYMGGGMTLRISIFYTRAQTGRVRVSDEVEKQFPGGLSCAPGRPKVGKVLEGAISRAVALSPSALGKPGAEKGKDDAGMRGMIVGVCGPVSLADEVAAAVGTIEPLRRDQVGGVELHEE